MSKIIELNAYKQKKENKKAIAPKEPKKDKYDLAMERYTPEEHLAMQKFLFDN